MSCSFFTRSFLAFNRFLVVHPHTSSSAIAPSSFPSSYERGPLLSNCHSFRTTFHLPPHRNAFSLHITAPSSPSSSSQCPAAAQISTSPSNPRLKKSSPHQLSQLDNATQREVTLVTPQGAAAHWKCRYRRYLRERGMQSRRWLMKY
jgi:hypothetical protein